MKPVLVRRTWLKRGSWDQARTENGKTCVWAVVKAFRPEMTRIFNVRYIKCQCTRCCGRILPIIFVFGTTLIDLSCRRVPSKVLLVNRWKIQSLPREQATSTGSLLAKVIKVNPRLDPIWWASCGKTIRLIAPNIEKCSRSCCSLIFGCKLRT